MAPLARIKGEDSSVPRGDWSTASIVIIRPSLGAWPNRDENVNLISGLAPNRTRCTVISARLVGDVFDRIADSPYTIQLRTTAVVAK